MNTSPTRRNTGAWTSFLSTSKLRSRTTTTAPKIEACSPSSSSSSSLSRSSSASSCGQPYSQTVLYIHDPSLCSRRACLKSFSCSAAKLSRSAGSHLGLRFRFGRLAVADGADAPSPLGCSTHSSNSNAYNHKRSRCLCEAFHNHISLEAHLERGLNMPRLQSQHSWIGMRTFMTRFFSAKAVGLCRDYLNKGCTQHEREIRNGFGVISG